MNYQQRKFAKTTKRFLPLLLALILTFVLSSSALAAGKPDQTGKKPDPETKQHDNGKRTGDETDSPSAKAEKKQYKGISVEKIALAIDNLTDETQRAELTALLETYLAALDGKDTALTDKTGSLSELSQAASEARQALKDGLSAAGYTLGSVLGWQEWKEWQVNEPLNLTQITAAIAALEEGDEAKAQLTSLLTAYQELLAQQEAAGEDSLDQAKEAAQAAREALLQALYEAGLLPIVEPTEIPPAEVPAETPAQ